MISGAHVVEAWSWYAEAKQWQAGIAALLGFLGLILAALWNFRLNRRRDRQLRGEETMSVASALYGEILLLRNELALLARVVGGFAEDNRELREIDQFTYAPSTALLYPALAHKLGLLPSELLLGITEFYAHVEGARRGFESYRRTRGEGVSYNVRIVLVDAVRGVEDVKPVLRRIEQLLSIAEAKDPSTGRGGDVLENEEWLDAMHREHSKEREEQWRLQLEQVPKK